MKILIFDKKGRLHAMRELDSDRIQRERKEGDWFRTEENEAHKFIDDILTELFGESKDSENE